MLRCKPPHASLSPSPRNRLSARCGASALAAATAEVAAGVYASPPVSEAKPVHGQARAAVVAHEPRLAEAWSSLGHALALSEASEEGPAGRSLTPPHCQHGARLLRMPMHEGPRSAGPRSSLLPASPPPCCMRPWQVALLPARPPWPLLLPPPLPLPVFPPLPPPSPPHSPPSPPSCERRPSLRRTCPWPYLWPSPQPLRVWLPPLPPLPPLLLLR